ncbi:hypothetical protein ACSSS7_003518 [Eimeria intestinalis]
MVAWVSAYYFLAHCCPRCVSCLCFSVVTRLLIAPLLPAERPQDFHRRKLATRVAERRGKCFLYRYISADLPHLQGLLEEASAAPDATDAAALRANKPSEEEAFAAESFIRKAAPPSSLDHADATDGGPLHNPDQEHEEALVAADAAASSPPPTAAAVAVTPEPQGEDALPAAPRGRGGRGRRGRGSASVARKEIVAASASAEPMKRKQRGGARGRGSRKRLRVSEPPLKAEASEVKEEQQEPECAAAGPEAAPAAAPAAGAAAGSVESPPSSAAPPPVSQPTEAMEESNAGLRGESEQNLEAGADGGGMQRVRQHIEQLRATAATKKLPARTVRLLDTPQFAARLALFHDTIRSAGCSTIPTISKAIADMEQTANGPDRKTVQRMAEVAMELEPRIRRGRLSPSKAAASSHDRPEEHAGSSSPNAAGEITFFYWAETFDEATAEQRIATLITQRRAQGCRDAIRRNQLLLDGKLKEAVSRAGPGVASSATPPPLGPSSGALPATANRENVEGPPVHTMGEGPASASSPSATAESLTKTDLEDQQLRGLQGEISRLALLESRSSSGSVTQPLPAATAASLLVVEKTLSPVSPQDKVSFSQKHLSFYGFIFPVMIRAKCFHQYLLSLSLQLKQNKGTSGSPGESDWRRLAVSTIVKRMPLESFLRLVGCGYALPMLDQHLAKDSASRQPMAQLPGVLFRLLVFSSRQIQCYRQLHPKAKMPLLGLAKKNAGTAIRKLLSLLTRMGIVSRIQDVSSTPLSDTPSSKPPPTCVFWRLNETLHLPAFCTAEGVDVCEAKTFDGHSHEGVEAYWQQLQHQVSQWMLQAQRSSWGFEGGPEASQFFSPHSEGSEDDAFNPSDPEAADDCGDNAEATPHTRKRLRPPKDFDVPEAFNSKNWKGQIAFSGSARAAMDAFAAETLEKLRDAGGEELEAVVLNASSPQIAELAARIGCPADAVLRYLIRVFEIKGGPERNHALLVGGPHTSLDIEERGLKGEGVSSSPPAAAQTERQAAGVDESLRGDSQALPVEAPARQQWLGVATKVETKERDRGVGLIVHRTREVRFQCHHCGHFYSWERSIKLHYEKTHREPIPADEALYVLPWERKRRQEEKQQQAELSKFKRRRRLVIPVRETGSAVLGSSQAAEADKASSLFSNRLPTRGTVKAVEPSAKGFLFRASKDEEAVLASMSREDEIVLIGAAIVAERLWQALQATKEEPSACSGSIDARDSRYGPLTDAWLSPGTPQSFPPEDHLIWQVRLMAVRPLKNLKLL